MHHRHLFRELSHASWRIIRTDLHLFKRFPRLGLAVLAISLVPALYALIYLSSVWDPNTKTSALPVGVVNLDEGFTYQGRNINVGAQLSLELIRSGTFGFRALPDAQLAREEVRIGHLAFAVVIPKDFSANAVPGRHAGAGQVTVILSEGNNYTAAGFARRFATELGHRVNEALNEERWAQILLTADGTGKSLSQLKAGMAKLRTGAVNLHEGMERFNTAATQLSSGLKEAGAGIRTMDAQLPADSDLQALKAGSQRLTAGQKELGAGLAQLHAGSHKLAEGADQLQTETVDIPFVGEKIADAVGKLGDGADQLTDGLALALDANAKLTRGAARLEEGTGKLVTGLQALGGGIHTLAAKMPEDTRLDAFRAGSNELTIGAAKLKTGLILIEEALPQSPGQIDGSARGLADSVEPALEVLAPVANNGSAFAPNMIAMALWLGVVMAIHVFNVRILTREHAQAPALAKTIGKFALPSLVVIVQTAITLCMLVFGLGIAVPHPWTFALTMFAAAQAFLAIIFLLLRALGDAGKLIAVLLLTLQLAAGGGVMPIELSGGLFQAVHDWLPFTWVIKGFRASLFGAYNNGWLVAYTDVALFGLVAFLLASLFTKWHMVDHRDYRPGVEA